MYKGPSHFLALDRQAIDLHAIAYGDIRCGFPGSILSSRSPSMPDLENVRVEVIARLEHLCFPR